MKVYVLLEHWVEDTSLIAVFNDKCKAESRCEYLMSHEKNSRLPYSGNHICEYWIEEVEIDIEVREPEFL